MHPLRAHIEKSVRLSDEEFNYILSKSNIKHLKKNQVLLHEEYQAHSDYFVLKGCLGQYYTGEESREHFVQFGFANWWIGDWYSILNKTASVYTIESLKPSTVLQFSQQSLEEICQTLPKMERYFRTIFQHGFAAQQRRIAWLQSPAKYRYSEFQKVYGYFENILNQSQVASYLGITRESLSRLKRL